ncbi:MAG: 3-deoxy-7-phosphoheptulonate synthase [Gemmatimonadetes bacterium]|nr:3-deoxy-7-phosphoheptulonate synthase [Gemmatimonadota bacterium]
MLIVMKHSAREDEIRRVVETIQDMGYEARPIPGRQRTAIGLIGNDGNVDADRLEGLPGVLQVIPVTRPYKQVSREWKDEPTLVTLQNGTRIGGNEIAVMAGPCSVESEPQILEIAHRLKEAGATVLRGGAFKPRTSPYAFQGLGVRGLELLARAREETGMAVVTEALDPEGVELVAQHADIIQIGARNMQNYSLLRRAGASGKPILLKRGMAAKIEELLLSAEYILAEGNGQVILCERGVRSFDNHTRNLLDLTAIPVVHALSHLPIIADPSHGTGVRAKVTPMARAAVAAGADGIMVEVHPNPNHALSDGAQSLYPEQFEDLMKQIAVIAMAIGRGLVPSLAEGKARGRGSRDRALS